MKSFKDTENRVWQIDINVGSIKRVRDLIKLSDGTSVNLAQITDGNPPLLSRLGTDLILLIDVICAIVRPQLTAASVADEDFAAALGGAAINAAHEAFWEEMRNFSLSLRRDHDAKAIEKQLAMIKAAVAAVTRKIESVDMAAMVERQLGGIDMGKVIESTYSATATSSPESSGSTPPP